jgi:bacterioferritin-associated ferredoxin
MVVCHCRAVNDQTIDAAIASGARSVPDLVALCRAGGGCGGCHSSLQALIDNTLSRSELAAAGVGLSGSEIA